MNGLRRVAVGMSGGVDSTVAAMLLNRRKDLEVHGYFMRNWDEKEEGQKCSGEEDYAKVQSICSQLSIPCHRVEFIPEYWNEVFMPTVNGYEEGITPNPDVLCNAKIKFSAFFDHVRKEGFDYLATGHYARIMEYGSREEHGLTTPTAWRCILQEAVDKQKDQTYFLAGTPSSILSNVMFPLGGLHKTEVKELARDAGFESIAAQGESMGLCFIGKRRFQDFVRNYVGDASGDVVDAETGLVLSENKIGALLFTIGQNIRIGGLKHKYFVLDKNMQSKQVRVVPGRDHPLLYSTVFDVSNVVWTDPSYAAMELFSHSFRGAEEGASVSKSAFLQVRVRHQGKQHGCHLFMSVATADQMREGGKSSSPQPLVRVVCEEGIRAVAPGQVAVFYKNGICLGRATIAARHLPQLKSNL